MAVSEAMWFGWNGPLFMLDAASTGYHYLHPTATVFSPNLLERVERLTGKPCGHSDTVGSWKRQLDSESVDCALLVPIGQSNDFASFIAFVLRSGRRARIHRAKPIYFVESCVLLKPPWRGADLVLREIQVHDPCTAYYGCVSRPCG